MESGRNSRLVVLMHRAVPMFPESLERGHTVVAVVATVTVQNDFEAFHSQATWCPNLDVWCGTNIELFHHVCKESQTVLCADGNVVNLQVLAHSVG